MKAQNVVIGINTHSHQLVKDLLNKGEDVLWTDQMGFANNSDLMMHYLHKFYQTEANMFHHLVQNGYYGDTNELTKMRTKLIKNVQNQTKDKLADIELELTKHSKLTILTGITELHSKRELIIKRSGVEQNVEFKNLYIANSRQLVPHEDVMLNENVEHLSRTHIATNPKLPQSLAIIGLTSDNIQLADTLSSLGVSIKIFEKMSSAECLEYLDRSLFNLVIKQLMHKNVEFYFGVNIADIDMKRGRYSLTSIDNQKFSSDTVLTHSKREYVDDIGLKNINIKHSAKGIITTPDSEALIDNAATNNIFVSGEAHYEYSENSLVQVPSKTRPKKNRVDVDNIKVLNLNLSTPVAHVGIKTSDDNIVIKESFSEDFVKISYDKESKVVTSFSMSGALVNRLLGYSIEAIAESKNIAEVNRFIRSIMTV